MFGSRSFKELSSRAKAKQVAAGTEEGSDESKSMVSKFLDFAPPVLLVVIGKMATFGFMTHVAACKTPIELAAHQCVLQLFFFMAPFTEVASQTAQAFLPTYEERRTTSEDWAKTSNALAQRLRNLAVMMGSGVALVAALIPRFFGVIFTRDMGVVSAMKPLAMPLFLAGVMHGFICSAEGVLLVRRDLNFLAQLYAASAVIMPAVLIVLKRRAVPVSQVWVAFVWFQAVRALLLNLRVRLTAST
eukprot:FR742226.1.p1 GENE.FR742226.1~~FR742226.1.p1  ORF type:complete len:245 (+),score=25.34 FR742226.1:1-735(+)